MKEKIRDNGEKIKQNKVLPYLVANVVEVRLFSFLGRDDPLTEVDPGCRPGNRGGRREPRP